MLNKIVYLVCSLLVLLSPIETKAVFEELSGRILLQVESHGEAWYFSPVVKKRFYLGRPDDAFRIMREQGVGISNQDLEKIPTRDERASFNLEFAKKHKGKIFLAVEDKGQAWYINPLDLKRYYLGRPADAFAILQLFGLGISNANLSKIPAVYDKLEYLSLEKRINDLINKERTKSGLNELAYSDEIAAVAREHSENLARENKAFTSINKVCDLPMIHHEGLDFGISHSERLNNRNIYNFSRSGENIALIASLDYSIEYIPGDNVEAELKACDPIRQKAELDFKEKINNAKEGDEKLNIIKKEITKRVNFFNNSANIEPINIENHSEEKIAEKTVLGWMESPGHKKNILTAEYDTTGIGVAIIDTYIIATQVFTKKSECGFFNGHCCESGGCYVPYTCGNDGMCR
ncbi:MAG: Allergen V5/Tpx-1 family protein [Candidatus Falkowbacteria bacterium GW2011_GWC2_38_22]|uniref:Allergen V5/Tpx-1 family protein n=1 Tax=Candidatus Falkowbacteria bacterium GW2011_GWE1_38_31 TaxID=1618638 RepID=A0A0G0JX50_9BACT|nr:MAG: Allergen V5/Tpx-1 family protein [Candidatus Falkowbacteria bacterium GW2011_GWF2_38_1205]KKQ61390.1 MAG: Allergen V5/Tpx-1 family protein [Candidatus Falkowbacteria bacterium GW2011_GWC2_38_22]KKQ64027.1 MAG: Allergen V5/Tpx-1 family protein [Candidatus Falkowbacteria bacterium GW2011_GWF1_38_22]KKQ66625.1 MAG: Allergen V5/Tpx-1 family protein [Candidatus Falkowbacteria bacterium GW2011_GWE2_38_254]KKQ71132.1 MAG: Allergen V5/Tpx-1 family protein [Candidatus Falkowbacteria bacterium GW